MISCEIMYALKYAFLEFLYTARPLGSYKQGVRLRARPVRFLYVCFLQRVTLIHMEKSGVIFASRRFSHAYIS